MNRSSSRTLLGVALGAALLFSAPASLAIAASHPAPLVEVLRLIDVIPTVEQLRAAGAGADGSALAAVAADRALGRYERMRAASALVAFDSPATRSALGALVDREDDDREVRLSALAALTRLEKGRALPRLGRLLGSADPELRGGAIRNLARVGGPEAHRLLDGFVRGGARELPWLVALAEDKLRTLSIPR
jgi:HEAT repeat protein